jgi:hypothetical protein
MKPAPRSKAASTIPAAEAVLPRGLLQPPPPSDTTLPLELRLNVSGVRLFLGLLLKSGTKLFFGLRFESGIKLFLGLLFESGIKLFLGLRFASGIKLFLGLRFESGIKLFLGLLFESGIKLFLGLRLESGIKLFLGLRLESGIKLFLGLRFESGIKLFLGLRFESGTRLFRGLRFGSGIKLFLGLRLYSGTKLFLGLVLVCSGTKLFLGLVLGASGTMLSLGLRLGSGTMSPPILPRGLLFGVMFPSSGTPVGLRLSKDPTATLARRGLALELMLVAEWDGSVPLCGELVELLPALRDALRLRDEVVRCSIVEAGCWVWDYNPAPLARVQVSSARKTSMKTTRRRCCAL